MWILFCVICLDAAHLDESIIAWVRERFGGREALLSLYELIESISWKLGERDFGAV